MAMDKTYSKTERGEVDTNDSILETERNQKKCGKTAKDGSITLKS